MNLGIRAKFFVIFVLCMSLVMLGTLLLNHYRFTSNFAQYHHDIDKNTIKPAVKQLEAYFQAHQSWQKLSSTEEQWRAITSATQVNGQGSIDLALLDAERFTLIGKHLPHDKLNYQAIMHEDKTVGFLGYLPHELNSQTESEQYLARQKEDFMLIALIMFLISLFALFPITSILSNPVRKLATASKLLAGGKLSTRLQEVSNDEFGQLAKDFNMLARTLENNEKARSQWIADISHELRTPLSVLKAQLEALLDNVRETSPSQLKKLLKKTDELERLIDNLYQLSLADLGAITYRKEMVPIDDLLEELIDVFSESFSQSNITLEANINFRKTYYIYADEKRLMQLFNNLLNNTLRYTDSGGKLVLDASIVAKSVVITLNDTAPGVSQQDLPKIFDRLYRVEPSRNRRSGGSGLGLSICKNIIEAHNGTISASQSNLGGLCITLSLPVEKEPTITQA